MDYFDLFDAYYYISHYTLSVNIRCILYSMFQKHVYYTNGGCGTEFVQCWVIDNVSTFMCCITQYVKGPIAFTIIHELNTCLRLTQRLIVLLQGFV